MTAMVFLLKLTLCWGFFALLYALLLRHETFFRLNRLYLLSTAVLGVALAAAGHLLPALLGAESMAAGVLPTVRVGLREAEAAARQWTWAEGLWAVYALGAAITAARLAWGLVRLVGMARRGKATRLPDGCLLIETAGSEVPCSFFRWVFVPQTPNSELRTSNSELRTSNHLMLAHERAHAHGWHSADVLLMELLCIALWFHPLAHWYRRALRNVHEFLADEAASRRTDKKQYGLLLIRQAQSGPALALVHHFFQSPLKQRLIMLMKQHSAPIRAFKYGLTLPLVALFALLFQQAPALAQTPEEKPKELFDVDVLPEFPGGSTAMMKYLSTSIQYPETAKKAKIEGMVALGFVIEKDGTLSGVENLTPNVYPDLATEAVRVVRAMPKWTPGMDEGKPVKVKFTLPIKFKLD
jgi:TonB family protein